MRLAKLGLMFTLLVCLGFAVHQAHKPNLADFQVYDTAAALVHHGESLMIYDGADTGADPQIVMAKPGTPFARQAQKLGIDQVRLYVYPPVLADMLVPFSLVSAALAGKVWLALNIVALLITAWLTGRILGIPLVSPASTVLFFGVFVLFSTGMCLIWGQVTIVLLLLWTLGMRWYQQDLKGLSAIVLALAAAIKLTPLLVILPMLIWRDWRWLRSFCGTLVFLFGAVCLLNGLAPLQDFVSNVVPAMSGGIPNAENKSLISSVQLLWVALHHGQLANVTMQVPHPVLAIAKALAAFTILAAMFLLIRIGPRMRMPDRIMTFALIALLSAVVSPVAWKHAYVVEYSALAFIWAQVFRSRASLLHICTLCLITIELGSFLFDSVETKLFHGLPLAAFSFTAPLCALALVFWQLVKMRRDSTGADA